jgi:hypothetical protein
MSIICLDKLFYNTHITAVLIAVILCYDQPKVNFIHSFGTVLTNKQDKK